MNRVVYLVSVYEESLDNYSYAITPHRCFSTREGAVDYCEIENPNALQGFDYFYPDSGEKVYRQYWVEPIALEEVEE